MPEFPLVSIITVNYKNTKDTLAFLQSLSKINYPAVEVILVDNAATFDNSGAYQKFYPSLTYVYSLQNLGFAGANNEGIKCAKGKYLYFLNNDTIVDDSSIMPLVNAFENNKNLGAASPRIAFHSNPDVLQYAGMTPINFKTGRNKMIGKHQLDNPIFQSTQNVGYAHGAAMMIPRKLINEIGNMPTEYFLYYEELDWCEKIRQLGYEIKMVGEGKVIHKASASVKSNSPLQTFYMTRNRLIFINRFASTNQFSLFWKYFNWIVVPQKTFTFLLNQDLEGLKAFKQAISAAKTYLNNKALPLENYQAAA